jgi:chromosome segregation ATPase
VSDIDMSRDFAEARARGEAANMRDEVAALRLMLREVGATNASGIDYALRCQRERDEARSAYASAAREWAERHEHARERILGLTRERDLAVDEINRLMTEATYAENARLTSLLAHAEAEAIHCRGEMAAALAEAEEAARAYNDVAADLRRTAAERDELAAQADDRLMLVASLRAERDAAQRELHRLIHGTAIEGDGACEHEIHADAARAWARLWHREARRLWREVQDLSGMLTSVRAGALREAADIARAHGGISAYYAIRQLAAEVEP